LRKVEKENSLGAKFPNLVSSWHSVKNGDLTPFDVFPKSGRKVWWICEYGHEWEARIAGRSNGKGCPYCSGHKLGKTNCLSANFPEVAKEWHPKKNGDLTPFDVMQKTDRKVWWLCKFGHKWKAAVSSRVNGRGCPYCAGQRATKENNFAVKSPHLISEWHAKKNGDLTPYDFLPKSDKEIWWLCKKGHEWKAQIKKRTRGDNCPFCSSHRVSDTNNLAYLYPEIVKDWHPNKNGSLLPSHITSKSDKRVWWLCEKTHEWEAQVKNRSNGNNCPYCNNKLPTETNNFSVLHPEISKEWHPTRNGNLMPSEFLPHSNTKAWWKCNFEHEWRTSITSRSGGSNCPKCYSQTSRLEVRAYCEFKKLIDKVMWQEKIKGMECDLYLEAHNIAIEFDGFPWHSGKEEKDKNKNIVLQEEGITIIRVRDNRLKIISKTDVFYKESESRLKIIHRLFYALIKLDCFSGQEERKLTKYLENNKPINEDEYKKILHYLPSPPKEKSLQYLQPEIVELWDYERNSPLTPLQFKLASHKKVWWCCMEGHQWEARISHVSAGHGCPYCAGNIPTEENNLSITHPEIAEEWNHKKNKGLLPTEVKYGSNKKIWWTCQNGHEWVCVINSRINGSKCPVCKSLKIRFPKIAIEWHPTKNSPLRPDMVGGRSGKKVWWLCDSGHEWEAAINNRTAKVGSNCPICRSIKRRSY